MIELGEDEFDQISQGEAILGKELLVVIDLDNNV